jgi:hypothetical protein
MSPSASITSTPFSVTSLRGRIAAHTITTKVSAIAEMMIARRFAQVMKVHLSRELPNRE